MRFFLTVLMLSSLVYNQATFGGDLKQNHRPLLETITTYNEMRLDPATFASTLGPSNQKIFHDLLLKGNIQTLPEIKTIASGTYHLVVDKNTVIFDEKNWNQKKIRINNYFIDLAKIQSVDQLIKVIKPVVKAGEAQSSFFKIIKDLVFPRAYGVDKQTWYLLAAGVIAAASIGYLLHNRKDSDSAKSSKSASDTKTTNSVSAKSFSVTPIGESHEHGFFILRKFNGKLYAGAFGYSKKQKIFTYSPWAEASPGFTTGESVCDLREFNGYLYANTENQGQVFRTSDGNNWEKVLDVKPDIGCGLAVFNGRIYATELTLDSAPAEIHRSSDGKSWEKVYSSGSTKRYMKEIVAFQNKLYGFYVDLGGNQNGMMTSGDGTNWSSSSAPARFIRSYVKGDLMWLAATKKYSSSGESAIWTFDGNSFKKVYADASKSHISYISSIGNTMVATTTVAWKGKQGGATLLQSCDNGATWETVHTFKETEAWGMEEFDGALFVATKQDGGGGKIYKVEGLCK
ncbi:MAG: hypothetical protein A2381_01880 [Bdellovibrionales bacterium RIFOXYB1_FULL_37_110]|nr:MAG: hypothetical protein A2417_09830 [Bdellovibrionales bacterium RIFOXYC1_FULL_37_79]OFZ58965.1 MAG: hypothetical protein A2381_01880 [Bdellovibrionales bacterium RIFOXYB1_FULL_37_110]OFZ64589.1 MAG: hypothetical protein A2577_13055 [Bdellovibrionales bacterium RIFOXYD1_FULL_36_51]